MSSAAIARQTVLPKSQPSDAQDRTLASYQKVKRGWDIIVARDLLRAINSAGLDPRLSHGKLSYEGKEGRICRAPNQSFLALKIFRKQCPHLAWIRSK